MTSQVPVLETGTVRSDSAASTRDSASQVAELASQAIELLQKADPHTVVTGLLKEKSYLHTQNGQLWRLVDKQRAAYDRIIYSLTRRLLDLQRDYQKVLQDKNRYQARLKTQKQQDSTKFYDRISISTESSAQALLDLDGSLDKTPSRRSSARSVKSFRPPRSPQPGSQLDALQASLEAEIAKSADDSDTTAAPIQQTDSSNDSSNDINPPVILTTPQRSTSKVKKLPAPLDLTPTKTRSSDIPRSAFLAPGSGYFDSKNGRLSPFREPPPSAPPFQTTTSDTLSINTRQTPPPLLSPGLAKSPRPYTPTFQPLTPMSGKIIYDESESRGSEQGPPSTPRTSKPPTTDTEDLTDSTSSPTTPIASPISPTEALVVETSRKSPLVPRRSRMPSHRSNNSQSHASTSSIGTINGPTGTTIAPVVTRASRSMSVESQQPISRTLVPPEESLERRKSRSFDDLQSLINSLDQEEGSARQKVVSPHPSLTGIGLDETIMEMQEANEKFATEKPQETTEATIRESESVESFSSPEHPRRAPPTPPTIPATPKSPTGLQPPFTLRSRSSSNVSKPISLAINPKDIPSVLLSVLSVRSRQISSSNGPVDETLFTIRCRVKSAGDRTSDKEILRVEKSFGSLMDLGEKLSSIVGMKPFLNSFFDDFPKEKSDQRKVIRS
jgi:hypothetical protein